MSRDTRCLSVHGRYQCRHRGACCTAGWPIPVETDRLARLRAALATGALRPAETTPPGSPFLFPPDAPADTPALLVVAGHQCVFYDMNAHRCGVQQSLDHDALPLACRQFPRVSVHDPRGTSVTLSHYCPTAASMLDTDAPVSIVTNAAAFPPGGEYVGLDARGRRDGADAPSPLPPLLRPGVMMDWDSWWEWERLSVDWLANSGEPPASALGRLGWAVEHARRWRPADGPLIDRVREAFDDARAANARPCNIDDDELALRVREVTHAESSVGPGFPGPSDVEGSPASGRRPADAGRYVGGRNARFLAAHAFANWTAHLGRGLRTWLRSVEAPYALLLSGLDVREADLHVRHLADPAALARTWSKSEIGR